MTTTQTAHVHKLTYTLSSAGESWTCPNPCGFALKPWDVRGYIEGLEADYGALLEERDRLRQIIAAVLLDAKMGAGQVHPLTIKRAEEALSGPGETR